MPEDKSTTNMLSKLSPKKILINKIDSVRNSGKEIISPDVKKMCMQRIGMLLTEMSVQDDIKAAIMQNAAEAEVMCDFSRTLAILSCLNKHKLKGYSANEFFKGAHFKIEDNGALYHELKQIAGAETRFSSHFEKSKIDQEKGISCGRILPEVLFLQTRPEEGINFSHFQAEASPWRMHPDKPLTLPNKETLQTTEHVIDSAKYFIHKRIALSLNKPVHNLGPYGWSKHDDANPIRSCNCASEAENNKIVELSRGVPALGNVNLENSGDDDEEIDHPFAL